MSKQSTKIISDKLTKLTAAVETLRLSAITTATKPAVITVPVQQKIECGLNPAELEFVFRAAQCGSVVAIRFLDKEVSQIMTRRGKFDQTSIDALELDRRIINGLKNNSVFTVGYLRARTEDELKMLAKRLKRPEDKDKFVIMIGEALADYDSRLDRKPEIEHGPR